MKLEFEPHFVGLGPYHIASGVNNFGYFFRYRNDDLSLIESPELIAKNDFFSKILDIKIGGEYAAILTEVNCYL